MEHAQYKLYKTLTYINVMQLYLIDVHEIIYGKKYGLPSLILINIFQNYIFSLQIYSSLFYTICRWFYELFESFMLDASNIYYIIL